MLAVYALLAVLLVLVTVPTVVWWYRTSSGALRGPSRHLAAPGCPVVLTDGHDFTSAHRCLDPGWYDDVRLDAMDGTSDFAGGAMRLRQDTNSRSCDKNANLIIKATPIR